MVPQLLLVVCLVTERGIEELHGVNDVLSAQLAFRTVLDAYAVFHHLVYAPSILRHAEFLTLGVVVQSFNIHWRIVLVGGNNGVSHVS